MPGFRARVWFGLFAPKATPRPVIDKLHAAIDKALQNQKVKDALAPLGIEEKRGTPAEVGAYLAAEVKRWTDRVAALQSALNARRAAEEKRRE